MMKSLHPLVFFARFFTHSLTPSVHNHRTRVLESIVFLFFLSGWFQKFMLRHPKLSNRRVINFGRLRAGANNERNYREWFEDTLPNALEFVNSHSEHPLTADPYVCKRNVVSAELHFAGEVGLRRLVRG